MRSLAMLPDLCRTLYPQAAGVRDTQHRTRFRALQYQVGLIQ
jgi:hypothetical protein